MSHLDQIQVITLFPEMIEGALRFGVVGQAVQAEKLKVTTENPRTYTNNVHQSVDDRPYGGGDGMVMLAEPLAQAIEAAKNAQPKARVIHLSPRGTPLTDAKVRDLSRQEGLILVASRYGGIDQRLLNTLVDEEISIGDYVLSGGELGALVIIDAVARLIPGVLGHGASAHDESFAPGQMGQLEQPQYTRPREWRGQAVPEALLSGDHTKVASWKRSISILVTAQMRPDLLTAAGRAEKTKALAVFKGMSQTERAACGLTIHEKDLEERLQ